MKLKCLLFHKGLKVNECNKEYFKNEDRAITVYSCKYCGKTVAVIDRYKIAHFKMPEGDKK